MNRKRQSEVGNIHPQVRWASDDHRTKSMMKVNKVSLRAGDIVHLKSGGPPMIIEQIDRKRRESICHWFDSKGHPFWSVFPFDTLSAPSHRWQPHAL